MAIDIRPIDPATRAFFAAEVSGIDLTHRLSDAEVAAIHGGMDKFAVLVFRDQRLDDESQLAFSRQLGPLETATGDIAAPEDRRISMDLNDISNLDKHGRVVARDDRRRLFGLGNLLWHSDSSFKEVPAKYSLLSARTVPSAGGNTEFADMRAAYDALDEAARREVHDLVCLHSQI
jgi:alpha-ketoglutarate-dependent 2,4-dichlorophenoxyacetate dioxygenase